MIWTFLISCFILFANVDCQDPFKAALNGKVILPCNISVSENEFVFSLLWKHDGNDVAIRGGNMTIYHGNHKGRASINPVNYELTLDNLVFSDDGGYVCTLTTSKGSTSRSSSVVVLASPTVKAFAIETSDDGSNDPTTLAECNAYGGSKDFKMSWVTELGDLVIPDSFKVETPASNDSNLYDAVLPLTIQPDAQRNNGRQFTCVVVDALGNTVTSDTYLKVTVPTTTPQSTTMQAFPQILIFPSKKNTMKIGEDKSFECLATGVPTPDLTWVNQDEKIISSGSGSSFLKIDSATYEDAGKYFCKVSNVEGETERSFQLSVQGPPVITSDTVEGQSESVFMVEGWVTVNLDCEASGNPTPSIVWAVENVNDTDLDISETITKMGDKIISSVNISAKHFDDGQEKKVNCFASNELGVAEKEFLVIFPVMESANAGLIVGVVIAIMVIMVVVFLIIFFALTRRSKSSDVTSPTEIEKGCTICPTGCFTATPCGGNDTEKAISTNEDGEQVKEVKEDGTSEEKQKLTEAEEQPAEQDKAASETSEEEEKNEEGAEEKNKEQKSEKKRKIRFGSQCCRGNEEDLKDEENKEKEEKVENGEVNSEETGEKKAPQEKENADKDSGKGDTLEKVAEVV